MDYWVLTTDAEDGGVIDSAPDGGPDDWKYTVGVSLTKEYPKKNGVVVFSPNFPKQRKLYDFQPNLLNIYIVSARVRDVLSKFGGKSVEFLPLTVKDHKKKVLADDYAILNPIGTVDAIDRKRSKCEMSEIVPGRIDYVQDMRLDAGKIPSEAKVFRLGGLPKAIVVDDDVKVALEAAKITGLTMHAANGWDSFEQS